jgi:phage tail-like protein
VSDTATNETAYLLQTFKFRVTLTPVDPEATSTPLDTTGAFSECSGLQLEADVKEYNEGGRNDGVVRRVGRVKLVPLVLKRGMFSASATEKADSSIWDWMTAMVSGAEVRRYHGQVELMDPTLTTSLATWTFDRGLPAKVIGPTLNAKTGDIAVEELHIAHEGLRLGART